MVGDACSSEHVSFSQLEISNALSSLSFLSQEFWLVDSRDLWASFELIKVVFSLLLILDNQYKLGTFLTLISVIQYKDWVRLGLDSYPVG
jgi:hypothetical protein